MRIRRLINPVAMLGLAVVAVAGTGSAVAATGGSFILGRSNSATATTALSNPNGTALALSSKAGSAPLAVNSSTRVPRLNSDLLDGLTASQLQRRVTGSCPTGAVRAITATGGVTCAALPQRVVSSRTLPYAGSITTDQRAIATFNGTSLVLACTRYYPAGDPTPNVRLALRLTGAAGVANGHLTLTDEYQRTVVVPVGRAVGAPGSYQGEILTMDAVNDGAGPGYGRASATVIVDNGGKLTGLVVHAVADARDATDAARPCTVWAVMT